MEKQKKHSPNNIILSVITPSFNGGKFLETTLASLAKQTYKNFEHIVIDGGSTDKTLSILKKHPQIRYISEKDKGYHDAVLKGVAMAKGKYITVCMVSDGYVNNKWYEQCIKLFESDPEVSLVWGLPQWMTEDGQLKDVSYPHFHKKSPPQKQKWFSYWLATGESFPDGNFMVRANVYKDCIPPLAKTTKGREYYDFNYNFNTKGYLAYHLPVLANYGREHEGQLSRQWLQSGFYKKAREYYYTNIKRYEDNLKSGKIKHTFRNGEGKVMKNNEEIAFPSSLGKKVANTKIMVAAIKQRGPYKLKQMLKRYI